MAETPNEQYIKLSESDVRVGVALPWSTFDDGGRLLLREGVIINSKNQLMALLDRGMYRHSIPYDGGETPLAVQGQRQNPFVAMGELMQRSRTVLQAIVAGNMEDGVQRINNVCSDGQRLCAYDADAVLAAMHLGREGPYSIAHSLCCALLTDFITSRLGFDQKARLTTMAAAFTSNVGMLGLQDQLLTHQGPLSEEIRQEIRLHPQRGVALLKAAGVDDGEWLAIVEQHHEKSDGTGYHQELSGEQIRKGARVVSVADRYHAMISDRVQRVGLAPTTSLRKLFTHKEGLEEQSVRALIKELGIYPPGIYVRLFNGELGVVTRRGKDGVTPQVASFISPRGAPYVKPLARDCSIAEYSIKEMIEPLSLPDAKLHGVWGYGDSP